MNIANRVLRFALWSALIAAPVAVFLAALRIGVGALLLALAGAVVLALVTRIAALRGAGWAERLWNPLLAGIGARINALAVEPAAAPEPPPMAFPPTRNNRDWLGALRNRAAQAVAGARTAHAPGELSRRQWLAALAAMAVVAIPIVLRLYRLDDLQAEMYGDINIVHEYVSDIRSGFWPFNFILSSGPLYHYLIWPIVGVTGMDYAGLKLASVIVSLGTVLGAYLLSRRLAGHSFALVAAFVTGVSSWMLIFSRLGNSQIAVPMLVMLALWLIVRYLQGGGMINVALAAVVSTLGLYGYPQSFVVGPTMFVTLLVLRLFGQRVEWRALGLFLVTMLILAVPFAIVFSGDSEGFVNGYIGGKFFGAENVLQRLVQNFTRAMLAFHVSGDNVFRSNPPGVPHLDLISGIFMLAGLVYWLRGDRRRWLPLFIVPFILLQAPSMLVINFQEEVPSASRTLGAAPIAYILVASGIWWLFNAMLRRGASQLAAVLSMLVVLGAILGLNMQRYFERYIAGLPYDNTPVARILTNVAETLPPATNLYLYHCCWETGMPEPKSIEYELAPSRRIQVITLGTLNCDSVDALIQRPAVLFWDHLQPLPDLSLAACAGRFPAQTHTSPQGKPVFNSAVVLGASRADMKLFDPLASPLPEPPSGAPAESSETYAQPVDIAPGTLVIDELASAELTLSGSPVVINHSLLDIGGPEALVDGESSSPARAAKANPFVIDVAFLQPRNVRKASVQIQTIVAVKVFVTVTTAQGESETTAYDFFDSGPNPVLTFDIADGATPISDIKFEIVDKRVMPGDGYHMHVFEVQVE